MRFSTSHNACCATPISKRIGEEFAQRKKRLVVATTHVYARYQLRSVIRDFSGRHADVQLALRQGSPAEEIAHLVAAGGADIGISSEAAEPVASRAAALSETAAQRYHAAAPSAAAHQKAHACSSGSIPDSHTRSELPGGSAVLRAFARARIEPKIGPVRRRLT